MLELPASSAPVVYQLRIVLRHISPLIWRRLLVRSDSTVTSCMLHRFIIQGRHYGDGGRADPRRVRLGDLGLRVGEAVQCSG